MNIFNIAFMEIKRDFRDVRTLLFMLAFPILLMLVLGTSLSNAFTTSVPIKDVHVLYKDQSTTGEFSKYFNEFVKGTKDSGIHFKKANNNTDGEKEVKRNQYDGYISIQDNGIKLYINEGNSVEGSVIQGMLTSFVDKYNVGVEVAKIDPTQVKEVFLANHDDYIKDTSIASNKQPGSMDYYAIAMTTMIALYGAMSASKLITGERVRKTADRLIVSPISKFEIFIGKILGSLAANFLCIIVVVYFSKFFFKANWGNHLLLVFIVLLTEVLLSISLGLVVSYITKSNASSRAIIMIVVQLSSFFGGAYFKLGDTSGILKIITHFSPLTWVNTAITKIIYTNDLSAAFPALIFNIGFSLLFLVVASISLQRREGL
ncbi:ABC transporter permease [Bacillus sp. AFS002410]|uniref:ABC transporter permease n=1 Tax=Bacillus sp. AFS002410 TaxID=2033481 RepID=UPI000BF1008E|nr:ABC transporter permease [Bacillus sp. AFS002410]PEJ53634.1 ABC transporter permease [Bacillus sp. AFS002410]